MKVPIESAVAPRVPSLPVEPILPSSPAFPTTDEPAPLLFVVGGVTAVSGVPGSPLLPFAFTFEVPPAPPCDPHALAPLQAPPSCCVGGVLQSASAPGCVVVAASPAAPTAPTVPASPSAPFPALIVARRITTFSD